MKTHESHALSEQPVTCGLPKENSAHWVTQLSTSVAKKWVDHLIEATLSGRCKWAIHHGTFELQLTDDIQFCLDMNEVGDIELEVMVIKGKQRSCIDHHSEKEYRSCARFFTKKNETSRVSPPGV
jgi:hypothetical protein